MIKNCPPLLVGASCSYYSPWISFFHFQYSFQPHVQLLNVFWNNPRSMASNTNGTTEPNGDPSPSPFETALEEFKNNLSKQHVSKKVQESFQVTSLQDLEDEINRLRMGRSSKRRFWNMKKIRGFIEAVQELGNVIEVFCQTSEIVCFLWVRHSITECWTTLLTSCPGGPIEISPTDCQCPCRNNKWTSQHI